MPFPRPRQGVVGPAPHARNVFAQHKIQGGQLLMHGKAHIALVANDDRTGVLQSGGRQRYDGRPHVYHCGCRFWTYRLLIDDLRYSTHPAQVSAYPSAVSSGRVVQPHRVQYEPEKAQLYH